jgi:hypothetical protein
LASDYDCKREISAYFFGETTDGEFGLPYQVRMLREHGLTATFFVDPLFSYALGLDVLKDVVRIIQDAGQAVALHLHPEWVTDPRCRGLPEFRGPLIAAYPVEVQRQLLRIGLERLEEAGARNVLPVFRSGSWGGDLSTLEALRSEGFRADCSLNAVVPESMPSLPSRERLQEPADIGGILEYPLSRIDDRRLPLGRPLSFVAVSWSEMRFALQSFLSVGRKNAVLVMHSNEFVATERLWGRRAIRCRRAPVRRFEKFCAFMQRNSDRFSCGDLSREPCVASRAPDDWDLPKSNLVRTWARMGEQLADKYL